jgi:hypothetical protein
MSNIFNACITDLAPAAHTGNRFPRKKFNLWKHKTMPDFGPARMLTIWI